MIQGRGCTLVDTTDVDTNGSPDDVHISAVAMRYLRSIASLCRHFIGGITTYPAMSEEAVELIATQMLLAEASVLAARYPLERDKCVPSSQFDSGRLLSAVQHEMVLQPHHFLEAPAR